MHVRFPGPYRGVLRRYMPHSLLWRTLLMVLVPMLLLQAVTLRVFYAGYLDVVSRRLSGAVAGEIANTVELMRRYPKPEETAWILAGARQNYNLSMRFVPGGQLPATTWVNVIGPADDDLFAALSDQLRLPFTMDWESDQKSVVIVVKLSDGVLEVEAPRKRLYAAPFYLFLIWVVGSAAFFFGIASLFIRNQVRAFQRLARAAENFGMGRDAGPIHPEGATEVRAAAVAFNRMQDRIKRFLTQRTEMLAGVSHDLRTPLTRLRLSLELLPHDATTEQDIADMAADIAEMEAMIESYLSFARGEGGEPSETVDLGALLADIAASARRAGGEIELAATEGLMLPIRGGAVRRAIQNLVDNALRHATHVALRAGRQGNAVLVTVDDDGPGIAEDKRESVFRPFESGAEGGTGLGLTIARDIVRAHGGELVLLTSPMGGLRAQVRLPA